MRPFLKWIAFACVAVGGSAAWAEERAATCTAASLKGTYAYGYSSANASDTYRYSASGMESYDGGGHFTWYQLWNDAFGSYTYSGTGTYEITSLTDDSSGTPVTVSCVAKVVYTGYSSWTFFVAPDGDAYYYSANTPSSLEGGKVERISRALLVK